MPDNDAHATGLLDPDRALELVLEHTSVGPALKRPLGQLVGMHLAAGLEARCPQPPFSRGLMDGFAVRVGDAGRVVRVVGEAAAGHEGAPAVVAGTAVEIMTGAECPPGTEAVVKVEDVEREGDSVRLPAGVSAAKHVQEAGSLCGVGETILPAGTELSALSLATATACGCTHGHVARAPTVAIVTTGDELSSPGEELTGAHIYDSNGPMLMAMARGAGVAAPERLHAADDSAALEQVLEKTEHTDIVVLSGGVSMGRYDLVPRLVEAAGATTVFHKVRQKPGKPLLFATRGKQLIFGLPGTPLGSHLGFHRYVTPCIRKILGRPPRPHLRRGRLSGPIKVGGARTLFRLIRAERDEAGWHIDPLRWRGSSDVVGPALANGYCRLEPSPSPLQPGTELSWEPIEGAR